MSVTSRVEREIIELHAFFQQWYCGELPNTDEAFNRFASVLAPDFQIIMPDCAVLDRAEILNAVRNGHGDDRNSAGGFTIVIRNVNVRYASDEVILATYEEWQRSGEDSERGRLSTVLFTPDANTPKRLMWQHVHETWLAASR